MEPYMIRFAGPGKKYRDPRKEKERDYRRGISADHYDKESTSERRRWNRMNRNRMRQALRNAKNLEEIEEIYPLKKTSGWWTW